MDVFVCVLMSQSEEFKLSNVTNTLISFFSSLKPITKIYIILAYNPLHCSHLKGLNIGPI